MAPYVAQQAVAVQRSPLSICSFLGKEHKRPARRTGRYVVLAPLSPLPETRLVRPLGAPFAVDVGIVFVAHRALWSFVQWVDGPHFLFGILLVRR